MRNILMTPALAAIAAASLGAAGFAQEAPPTDAAAPAADELPAGPADVALPAAPVELTAAPDEAVQPVEAATPSEDLQPTPVAAEETPADPDNMAAYLNAQQKIQQNVKFTRTIDGTVVDTKEETITYSPDDPVHSTEAGMTPLERLKAQFDSETLTRKEAVDEAKLDFVIADKDRDGKMTADEFVFLVDGWQNATVEGGGRDRFVDPVDHESEEAAAAEHENQARTKFAFIAGETGALTSKQYLKAAMADFALFDANKDGLLKGDELLNFREASRGEPTTHAIEAPADLTSSQEPQQ